MTWDGPEELELYPGGQPLPVPLPGAKKAVIPAKVKHEPEDLDGPDSDEVMSSEDEDEYLVGGKLAKGPKVCNVGVLELDQNDLIPTQQRGARAMLSSDSDSDDGTEVRNKPTKKRRSQGAAHPPPAKRKKVSSNDMTAADDPARKYCLGKLQVVFRDIFLRYPYVPVADGDSTLKKSEDLTEEETSKVLERSQVFAADLEESVYDTYGEPDKDGDKHAGPKYKFVLRYCYLHHSAY